MPAPASPSPDFESCALLALVTDLVASTPPDAPQAYYLLGWLGQFGPGLGIAPGKIPELTAPKPRKRVTVLIIAASDWQQLALYLTRHLAKARKAATGAPPSRLETNLRLLHAQAGIPPMEAGLFSLVCRLEVDPRWRALVNAETPSAGEPFLPETIVFRTLGLDRAALRPLLRRRSLLMQSGLMTGRHFLNPQKSVRYVDDEIEWINPRVVDALEETLASASELAAFMLGEPVAPELEPGDFEHMADLREFVVQLLRGARAQGQPGVNVLLFGESGTGKTQFCRMVAREAGMELFEVRSNHAFATQADGSFRLHELQLANSLLRGHPDALVLLDELEDLLHAPTDSGNPFTRRFATTAIESKAFFNNLLEKNATPVLWTSNSLDALDPAFLRRMTLVLEFRTPPPAARERIWRRSLERHGVTLPESLVTDLASCHELSPGFVANAVVATRLTGDGQAATTVLTHAARALNARRSPGNPVRRDFDASLANTSQPLAALENAIVQAPGRAIGLCLYGPPGTGKSAWARHLAQALGMEVMFRRASDLLGKYVGQTEQRIAALFAEAIERNAFLILDEADSLLRGREQARAGWEVTQVNEMLTWMEAHPLPFAFTTNLMEDLDRAAMRRFTFKVRFDYLRPEQAARAFRHFLGAEPPAEVTRLDQLTPGDFAVVRQRAEVLGINEPPLLLAMLREEVGLKRDPVRRAMGFLP